MVKKSGRMVKLRRCVTIHPLFFTIHPSKIKNAKVHARIELSYISMFETTKRKRQTVRTMIWSSLKQEGGECDEAEKLSCKASFVSNSFGYGNIYNISEVLQMHVVSTKRAEWSGRICKMCKIRIEIIGNRIPEK